MGLKSATLILFHSAQDTTPSKKSRKGSASSWRNGLSLAIRDHISNTSSGYKSPMLLFLEVEEQGQPYTHPSFCSSLLVSYGLLLEVLHSIVPALLALYS